MIITWLGSPVTQTDTNEVVAPCPLCARNWQYAPYSQCPKYLSANPLRFFNLQTNARQNISVHVPDLKNGPLKICPWFSRRPVLRVDTPIGPVLPLPFSPSHWPWMAIYIHNNKLITYYVSPDSRTSFHVISVNVKLLGWHRVTGILLKNPWEWYCRCGSIYLFAYVLILTRLATGRTVQGSDPGGRGRYFPHCPWGPPSHLNNGYHVFPASKAGEAWR